MAVKYGTDTERRIWEGLDAVARCRWEQHQGIVGHRAPAEEDIRATIRERSVELSRGKYAGPADVPEWLAEREYHSILGLCFSSLMQKLESETERPHIDYPHQRARSLAWLNREKRAAFERAWKAWKPGLAYTPLN